MADYTQKDLPVRMHSDDLLHLDDGTSVRWEGSGEAKDIMLNDDFSAACQLFPGNAFELTAGGRKFRITTDFTDDILVEAV